MVQTQQNQEERLHCQSIFRRRTQSQFQELLNQKRLQILVYHELHGFRGACC